jgi:DNA-binding transcriptional regulator YiaG
LPDIQIDIKALREQKGLSQAELARQLNVAQTVVGKWERGKSKPSQIMLDKLHNILA